MNRLRVLGFVVGLLGLSHVSSGQIIDSAHWPFPDTIWTRYTALGDFTGDSWDARDTGAHGIRHYGTLPHSDTLRSSEFEAPFQFFTRADILSSDSVGCKLLKGNYPVDYAMVSMALDTLDHVIISFDLKERGFWNTDLLEAEVNLKNLTYSRSSIHFREQDIYRHVNFISFTDDYETGFGDTRKDFCCPTSLLMFGDTLHSALDCPLLVYYDEVQIDSTSDKSIAITNTSNTDIKITSYTLAGGGFQCLDTSPMILHHLRVEVFESASVRRTYNLTLPH